MPNTLSKKVDYTQGKVLKNLLFFAIPICLSTLIQVLFNAADVAIIGQFGGDPKYQAAVGSTSSTVHIILNLFMGIALSANVVMSHYVGAKDEEGQKRTVHTSIATAFVSGFIVLVLGLLLSKLILTAIKCPSEIIEYSALYLQIYFLGAPAIMVYNFGASLLRSAGETKKPIYYLAVAGTLNVIINVVAVIFLKWHVVGVALGTTLSQYVSAVWVLVDLCRGKAGVKFEWKYMRFHAKELKKLLGIGIPMGLNSACYSLSNLFLQSSINAYGPLAIAGNTVGVNLANLCMSFTESVEKAIITFVGENVGAKKPERIRKITFTGLFVIASFQVCFGLFLLFFGKYACMIYNSDPAVIEWAMKYLNTVGVYTVTMCGMYAMGGALRGMGRSVFPMMITLTFTCLGRIIYNSFIYANFPVKIIEYLYIIYPITWIISTVLHAVFYFLCEAKLKRTLKYEAVFENKNANA